EISEWMNNPFGGNAVPAWQIPNSTGCQSNLETGDPLALMPNAGYPVLIDGFTYHPQNQVLMQWFQRGAISDAFEGAFQLSRPEHHDRTFAGLSSPLVLGIHRSTHQSR